MSPNEMADKEGIPIYPGALTPSGESSVTANLAEARYELVMITPDPIAKVAEFYKQKIVGLDGKVTGDTADFMGTSPAKTLIHITMGVRSGKTTIRAAALLPSSTAH